jgi:hypothetical protein
MQISFHKIAADSTEHRNKIFTNLSNGTENLDEYMGIFLGTKKH